jgi:hypothetical protein
VRAGGDFPGSYNWWMSGAGAAFYSTSAAGGEALSGTLACTNFEGAHNSAANNLTSERGAGPEHLSCSLAANGTMATTLHGTPDSTAGTSLGFATTAIDVGGRPSVGMAGAVISGFCADPSASRCLGQKDNAAAGGAVAWIGDSIAKGDLQAPYRAANQTQRSIGRAVYNHGGGGYTASDCLNIWTTRIKGNGYKSLISICGINSILTDVAIGTIESTLQTIFDQAISEGLVVFPVSILPFGGYDNTPSRQAARVTLNAWFVTYCAAHVGQAVCIDTSSLGELPPDVRGDHLHPGPDGGIALGALVISGAP